MRTFTNAKKFTHEDETQDPAVLYEVGCVATFSKEHNYGADADGRRGIKMTFLDDYELKDWKRDGISIEEADVPKDIVAVFENLVDECKDWGDE